MIMEKNATYELSQEERESLRKEIIDLTREYHYNPTESAVDKLLDEWVKNNGWMINLFKKHPNYNGKYQIVFDANYLRTTNINEIRNFCNWIMFYCCEVLVPMKISTFSYIEVCDHRSRVKDICDYMEFLKSYGKSVVVDGMSLREWRNELNKWIALKKRYESETYIYDVRAYTVESGKKKKALDDLARVLYDYYDNVITEEIAERVNNIYQDIKAVAGQKTSKLMRKICKKLDIDKVVNFEREFAKYADSINPIELTRKTVLSCHPVDFLTMSFGNSWASCHTIDKRNDRGMPDSYEGQYSSGTISYMLDDTSFVYYTIDKDYNGNQPELQPKINRNMFHIGEDKLIQGRIYPQGNDGDDGLYKQVREIVQKVIADCLEVPNMWKNVKGTNECRNMTSSKGTHYRDYTSFSSCNVSYLKDTDGNINTIYITVGHDPICIQCGRTHNWSDAIECSSCYDGIFICADCGCEVDEEDVIEINGEYYCRDCCSYCDYHEQYEREELTYVNNYGYVCDSGLDNDDFDYCERCEQWFYDNEEGFSTADGLWYCCEEHVRNDGYEMTEDGEWYPEDEVHYCEICKRYVHEDNWNEDEDCCNDCATEEREAI